MADIVEQKIKGRVYLYEVTNHWDKTKAIFEAFGIDFKTISLNNSY